MAGRWLRCKLETCIWCLWDAGTTLFFAEVKVTVLSVCFFSFLIAFLLKRGGKKKVITFVGPVSVCFFVARGCIFTLIFH